MYTLYYMPGACSLAIHVILKELGQEVKLENVRVPEGQPRNPEFLKINPRGQVPVLVEEDGNPIREGGAIITYLLDKYNNPLMPKSGKASAKALEWLMFANATMHPTYGRIFFAMRNIADQNAKNQIFDATAKQINKLWSEVDEQLATTKYICGDQISAADILLAVIANWGIGLFPFKIELGENVKRMLKDVISRPTFKAAMEKEGVTYKAV